MRRLTYVPKVFLNVVTPEGNKIGKFFTPSTTVGMILTSIGYQSDRFDITYRGKPLPKEARIGGLGLENDSELVIKPKNNSARKWWLW